MDEGEPLTERAVILARGLGTRMRRPGDAAPPLQGHQEAVAATGVKGMIPLGRPFLDYVLSALADAGYREACLVIGPEHDVVRRYYTTERPPGRIRVRFAVQERPLGTADAVAAAEPIVGADPFLVVNSDSYYPVDACRALRQLAGPGLAAFSSAGLVREGNLTAGRVAQFPVAKIGADGYLDELVESDDPAGEVGEDRYVSMNCWMFTPAIFAACRAIAPSARGELELPAAVRYAMRTLGVRFQVLRFRGAVLDLTSRADIAAVGARLAGVEVRL